MLKESSLSEKAKATTRNKKLEKGENPLAKGKYIVKAVDQPLTQASMKVKRQKL